MVTRGVNTMGANLGGDCQKCLEWLIIESSYDGFYTGLYFS